MEDQQVLFELPVEMELRKSQGGEDRRIVRGYASTETMDQQGETILQKGIDFSPLLKSGYINYDHQYRDIAGAKFPIIIGYPLAAEIRDRGLWVESELLKSTDAAGIDSEQLQLADEMWALGMALKKSGTRKLAYSVEGGVLKRHGKKIVKSVVRHCALTHKPVNEEATVDLFVKSFCCGKCATKGAGCQHQEELGKSEGAAPTLNALNTSNGQALLLENLDPRMTSVLYGSDPTCGCYDGNGRFYAGLAGAHKHLAKCRGYGEDNSVKFLRRLIKAASNKSNLAELCRQAGLVN